MRVMLFLAVLLFVASPVFAQAPPECGVPATTPMNPTRVCFEASVDHDTIDGYALDFIRRVDDVVVQTIDMGKPPATTTADGTRWVSWGSLNVMPVSFGTYYSVARAYGGGVSGPNSTASNDWDRAPGRPGGPRVVRAFKWLGKGTWAGLKGGGRALASLN